MTHLSDKRKVTPFKESHKLKYGLKISEYSLSSPPVVLSAVCLFCVTFGREGHSDSKRAKTASTKFFKIPFRTDNYRQHILKQHPTRWEEYSNLSDEEKRLYFTKEMNAKQLQPSEVVTEGKSLIEDDANNSNIIKDVKNQQDLESPEKDLVSNGDSILDSMVPKENKKRQILEIQEDDLLSVKKQRNKIESKKLEFEKRKYKSQLELEKKKIELDQRKLALDEKRYKDEAETRKKKEEIHLRLEILRSRKSAVEELFISKEEADELFPLK